MAMQIGGRNGIRDISLIESAVGRPYTGYYRRMSEKAAALLHSLVLNHGFIDGNKRTALLSLHLLLDRSGYGITRRRGVDVQDELEELILGIVDHSIGFEELVEWMEKRVR